MDAELRIIKPSQVRLGVKDWRTNNGNGIGVYGGFLQHELFTRKVDFKEEFFNYALKY